MVSIRLVHKLVHRLTERYGLGGARCQRSLLSQRVNVREVIRILERDGWRLDRQSGSHSPVPSSRADRHGHGGGQPG
jgi:hypothetical protein